MDPSPPPSPEFLLNAFCNRCGYDLRSNNVVGPCPKCGTELPYATFISGLANVNRLWLYRIYLGITGILIAQSILVVERGLQLLTTVAAITGSDSLFSYGWTRIYEVRFGVEWFSALFLLAAKEDPDEKEPWSAPRKLLLWFGGAFVIAHLARPFISNLQRSYNALPTGLIFHLMGVIEMAAIIVLFLYTLRLGQRAGDPILKRHLPLLVTLVIVSEAMQVIFTLRNSPLGGLDLSLGALVQAAVAGYAAWVLLKMRHSVAAVLLTPKPQQTSTTSSQ